MAQRKGQRLVAAYLPEALYRQFKEAVGERGMTPWMRDMIARAVEGSATATYTGSTRNPEIAGLLHDIERATEALAQAFEPGPAFYQVLERVTAQLIRERTAGAGEVLDAGSLVPTAVGKRLGERPTIEQAVAWALSATAR